jgi:hypothetical protein
MPPAKAQRPQRSENLRNKPLGIFIISSPTWRLCALAGEISESVYFLVWMIFASNYVKTWDRYFPMALDSQALFANLAERERVHGHHSPEGQAIRTLGQALDGWSSGNLAGTDVVTLCGQAVEDWLKRRLNESPWSAKSLPRLLEAALAANLLSPNDAARLQRLHRYRSEIAAHALTPAEIETVLETTIEIVEQHWT